MVQIGLELGKKIHSAYPNGFVGSIIVGDRGIGKSSYSLRVAHEIFRYNGASPNDAWRKALSCLKFSITDVVNFLEKSAFSDEKEIVLIWDDVGVHGGARLYFSDQKVVYRLKAVLDTVRTAVSGIIMTTPTLQGLLGVIKSYDDYLIEIRYTSRGGFYRMATAYRFRTLPSGKRIVKKKFIDGYNCYLPQWVFVEYSKMRKDAMIHNIEKLKKTVEVDAI